MDNRTRYEGIDGLKAYAIIGIALMHVLANGKYGIGGFVFERLIPSFTNLVFLFMMVSGFGMCCGYYQKFKEQKSVWESFTPKDIAKFGHSSHCFVRWTLQCHPVEVHFMRSLQT